MNRRQLLAVGAAAMVGGVLVGEETAAAIDQAGQPGTEMRSGRVTNWDTRLITVRVGGTDLPGMPYLRTYSPVLGDIVTVFGNAGTWVCVGSYAGSPPDNQVFNPSFEDGVVGSLPNGWGNYHDPASSLPTTVATQPFSSATPIDGFQVLEINGIPPVGTGVSNSSWDYTYSRPFKVTPGEIWATCGYAMMQLPPTGNDSVNVNLLLTFYANDTDVYPTTSAAGSGGTATYIDQNGAWTFLNAGDASGALVPAGAVYGRLTLRTAITTFGNGGGGPSVDYDAVMARKVRNADGSFAF